MKQGRQYLKAIMLILALMIASYLLYNVISSASTGVVTIQAALFSTAEEASVSGFIVRQEQPITAAFHTVSPTRTEGEKVAKGADIAISLQNDAAKNRLLEISQLEEQLSQLRLALTYQSQLTDTNALSQRISQNIAAFSMGTAEKNFSRADTEGETLKSLVLRQTIGSQDARTLNQQLSDTEAKLEALREQARSDTAVITAEASGYYSTVVDGYETILTPTLLETITLENFRNLWKQEVAAPANGIGRLITSDYWYFVTEVESALLKDLAPGDTLTVCLASDSRKEISMKIVSTQSGEDGKALLVLQCSNYISNISALRKQNARVIFHAYSGLRIPKEAIGYSEEEGSAGVYILEGAKARWKNVTLLYDGGDYYIAELDKSSTKNLWPEDEIILDARGITDGELVN